MSFSKVTPKLFTFTAKLLPVIPVFFASAAVAQQWVRLISDNNTAIYVDVDSIRGRGRYRYYWQQFVYKTPQNFDTSDVGTSTATVYAYMIYSSVDCRTKISRFRRVLALDKNNRVIAEVSRNNYGPLENLGRSRSPARYGANYVCSRRPRR